MMDLTAATTKELADELATRKNVKKINILKGQAYALKRCVADDNYIPWSDADRGDGPARILVVRD